MPPTMNYAGDAGQTGLLQTLNGLRRKVKVLGVVYGAGLVLASAVILLLAAVLIDWVLRLPLAPRLVINLAALVALGYAVYRWVIRPATSKLTLTDLAGRLEHVFPQFDDTLRSTVNFVVTPDVPGSDVMKQRTIAEATRRARSVDLDKAVALKPVWYSTAAGLGSLALVLVLGVVISQKFPEYFRIAADRLFGGATPWPKSVQIDVMQGVPQRVPVGATVPVKMRLTKGNPKKAIVKYRYDNGPWQQEVMERADDGTYTASLEARLESGKEDGQLIVRLEAGDDEQQL